jgi:tripeptidyl-peptidase-1
VAQTVDGTSAATPTFAGIVALLDDIRLNAGQPTLGWINPLIYQHPEMFVDIINGTSTMNACDNHTLSTAAGECNSS